MSAGGLPSLRLGPTRSHLLTTDDDAAAGLVRVAADGSVERGDAFGGVDDQDGEVCGFEVLASHDDGEFFRHQVGLALAADAGGVNEAEVVIVAGDELIDGIARGAGDGRHDGAVSPGEGVEQRGFADVGAADDRDLCFAGFVFAVAAELVWLLGAVFGDFGFFCNWFGGEFVWLDDNRSGDGFEDSVEQVADAYAVFGRDCEELADAERMETRRGGFKGRRVHFVDGEKERLAGA